MRERRHERVGELALELGDLYAQRAPRVAFLGRVERTPNSWNDERRPATKGQGLTLDLLLCLDHTRLSSPGAAWTPDRVALRESGL